MARTTQHSTTRPIRREASDAAPMVTQSARDFMRNHGPQWAAAIAFYGLLSLFPLLLLAAAIAAYFVHPNTAIQQLTSVLGKFLPQAQATVTSVVKGAINARGTLGVLSFFGLLWTGTRVFSAIMTALNVAFGVPDERRMINRLGTQIVLLVTIGLLFIAALASRLWLGALAGRLSLPRVGTSSGNLVADAVSFLLLIGVFTLLYHFAPRSRPAWEPAFAGGVFAALLFVLIRPLFELYITRFAKLNVIYGSMAILVTLLLWAWIVALVLLVGGYLVAHLVGRRRTT